MCKSPSVHAYLQDAYALRPLLDYSIGCLFTVSTVAGSRTRLQKKDSLLIVLTTMHSSVIASLGKTVGDWHRRSGTPELGDQCGPHIPLSRIESKNLVE